MAIGRANVAAFADIGQAGAGGPGLLAVLGRATDGGIRGEVDLAVRLGRQQAGCDGLRAQRQ